MPNFNHLVAKKLPSSVNDNVQCWDNERHQNHLYCIFHRFRLCLLNPVENLDDYKWDNEVVDLQTEPNESKLYKVLLVCHDKALHECESVLAVLFNVVLNVLVDLLFLVFD